ncbi:4-hydroxybenzoate octaprenyltransferase [Clostridia bacterium]|nr:4-hydroxybenzoate octaprenyltransferase [Clostridia bacterium]
MTKFFSKVYSYGNLTMFSHTVFLAPFGLIGMMWANGGVLPSWYTLALIVAALVFAQNGTSASNRIIDRHIDNRNPRTVTRPLQTGAVSLRGAWIVSLVCLVALTFCAWQLNTLCLALLPLALLFFIGYSYTKRFTWLCHFVLGVACGGAPVGAWAAVTGGLTLTPFVLGAAVTFWVAGFDIIYATQDIDFDRANKLHSVPARFGKNHALAISACSHAASVGLLCVLALTRGWWFAVGVACVGGLLFLERVMTLTNRRVNFIAYNMNAIVSLTFMFFGLLDILWNVSAPWNTWLPWVTDLLEVTLL